MKFSATILGELGCCAGFLMVMYALIIFGSAMIPYQPGIHSEYTYTVKGEL